MIVSFPYTTCPECHQRYAVSEPGTTDVSHHYCPADKDKIITTRWGTDKVIYERKYGKTTQ